MKRFRSLGRAGGFLAWCCHDEFLHLKQPLWCQCTGRIGEMSRESRADKEDRKIGEFSFTWWSFTFMGGHIRQHQGIYQTVVNMTRTPRVLGAERDQEQCDSSQTGSNSWGLRASHSVSVSLSLSHTHTGHSYSHALFPSWVIDSFSNLLIYLRIGKCEWFENMAVFSTLK